jgi:arylsulfatase A-like enzyme
VLGLALAMLTAGCPGRTPSGDGSPNVLLIVVDTLRADHVGCYGYERDTTPAVDALAAEGVRFERAYSTAPWTIPSVGSMLSGLWPSQHAATSFDRQLPDAVPTLAEMLSARGYDTAAVISHSAIDSRHNFQQGFEVFLESEAQGHDHLSTEGVTRQAIEQLERLERGREPFLLFVHYFDPHYNYKRHRDYPFAAGSAGRLDGDEPMRELLRLAPEMTLEEAGFLADLYDEEVRFTDSGIGRLLDRLRELGLADETLVVFTADHGEEFLDHGTLGHTSGLYEELVRVPLIIRDPVRESGPGVVSNPVSLVSLTPTILDLIGVDPGPLSLSGPSLASLLAGSDAGPGPSVFTEVDFVPVREGRSVGTVHKRAVITDRFKLIRDETVGTLEFYDLLLDPREAQPLASPESPEQERLVDELERLIALSRSEAIDPQSRLVDPAEVERLKSLGYVGD